METLAIEKDFTVQVEREASPCRDPRLGFFGPFHLSKAPQLHFIVTAPGRTSYFEGETIRFNLGDSRQRCEFQGFLQRIREFKDKDGFQFTEFRGKLIEQTCQIVCAEELGESVNYSAWRRSVDGLQPTEAERHRAAQLFSYTEEEKDLLTCAFREKVITLKT